MRRMYVVAGAMLVAAMFGQPLQAEDAVVVKQGCAKDCAKACCAKGGGDRADMMKKFDKDGDGKLSDEERAAAREARKAEQEKAMLAKFDKDGDGKLNDAEKAESDKAMSEHKGKGRRHGKPAPEAAPATTD